MVIVHVAEWFYRPFNGVKVVVPEHIKVQQNIEDVGFINLCDVKIEGVKNQITLPKKYEIGNLPEPFNRADLFIFHEVYKLKFLKLAKKLRKAKIPYIIIPHGCLSQQAQNSKKLKKTIGNLLFFNKFIKKAKAIQCLSKKEMDNTNFNNKNFHY